MFFLRQKLVPRHSDEEPLLRGQGRGREQEAVPRVEAVEGAPDGDLVEGGQRRRWE